MGAQDVADALWERVRRCHREAERLEAAGGDEEPDHDRALQLARARLRTARAAERAQLADALADQVERVTSGRRRRVGG